MAIENIFDFIDYLEAQGFTPGTANQNRYFVFSTLEAGQNATDNPFDLQSAYESVGVTLPQTAFNRIFDSVAGNETEANIIQYLSGSSNIPDESLPCSDYNSISNYVVYSDVLIKDNITGQYRIQPWTHFIDDITTPSALKDDIAESVGHNYDYKVKSISLNRMYKQC